MSETQQRVTGSFDARGDDGEQYHVVEFTDFVHTTTAEMAYGQEGVKEYKLGNGTPLRRLADREFEIEASGVKISIPDNL
jgi:hypothetical protein